MNINILFIFFWGKSKISVKDLGIDSAWGKIAYWKLNSELSLRHEDMMFAHLSISVNSFFFVWKHCSIGSVIILSAYEVFCSVLKLNTLHGLSTHPHFHAFRWAPTSLPILQLGNWGKQKSHSNLGTRIQTQRVWFQNSGS